MNDAADQKPRRRGRPRGRTAGVVPKAERLVVLYVQRRQHEWREKEYRERVPRTLTEAWLKEAIKRREEEFPETKGKLKAEDIRRRLLKRVPRVFLLGPRRKARRKQRALEKAKKARIKSKGGENSAH